MQSERFLSSGRILAISAGARAKRSAIFFCRFKFAHPGLHRPLIHLVLNRGHVPSNGTPKLETKYRTHTSPIRGRCLSGAERYVVSGAPTSALAIRIGGQDGNLKPTRPESSTPSNSRWKCDRRHIVRHATRVVFQTWPRLRSLRNACQWPEGGKRSGVHANSNLQRLRPAVAKSENTTLDKQSIPRLADRLHSQSYCIWSQP